MIRFTVPGTPKPLQRHRHSRWGTYDSKANKARKAAVVAAYRLSGPHRKARKGEAVRLTVEAVYRAPSPVSETRGQLKTDGADLSNLIKLPEDGLNGIAWDDDTQIACYGPGTKKRYTNKGEDPHTLIMIEILD